MSHSAIVRLWRRAPAWRWTLIAALLTGASFVAFPPPPPVKTTAVPNRVADLGPVAEFKPTLPVTPAAPAEPLKPADKPDLRPADTAQAPPPAPAPPKVGESHPVTIQSARLLPPANRQPGVGQPGGAAPPAPVSPAPIPMATPSGLTQPDAGLLKQPGLPPVPVNPNIGSKHRGVYDVFGRRVPLPMGEFEVTGYFTGQIGATEGVNVVLTRVEKQRLAALVFLLTTPASAKLKVGVRASADCARDDLFFKDVLSNDDFGSQDCVVVNHAWPQGFRAPQAANALRALATTLDTRGISLPPALVLVSFDLADRDGYLRVIYYFNPEMEGIQSRETVNWAESDWHKRYIARDPAKLAYMESARQWAEKWRPYLRQAFAGTLKDAPPEQLASTLH